jgi:hypothetical protein
MSGATQARHLTCSLCSLLSDEEYALEKVYPDENDTHLPEAVRQLEVVLDIRPGHPGLRLMQCPECKTYYLYRSAYEFLLIGSGSYDEYFLTRLTDEVAADYREGRRSEPL